MTASNSSLKASLSRFNIVSLAECECGDMLQMEEHIFWDCKLYEYQGATMMFILSENRKKKKKKKKKKKEEEKNQPTQSQLQSS
jgi:hypothetical protein